MIANEAKKELMRGKLVFDSDVFRIVLMQSGFVFDPDGHSNRGQIMAFELTTGMGYDVGTLPFDTMIRDDAADLVEVTFHDFSWVATGGNIGPANGAIIFDSTHPQNVLIGYVGFGTDQIVTDGGTFKLANIKCRVR